MINRDYKIIKVNIEEIDNGGLMSSLILRSGKRIITVLMPKNEVLKAELEIGKSAYCMINGKDITIFRDVRYFFNRFNENRALEYFYIEK